VQQRARSPAPSDARQYFRLTLEYVPPLKIMAVTPTASTVRPLRSGELARRAGVSPDTLRHYERRGLLPRPPRSAAGYRLYPPEALERVRLIRGALSIGFTVKELAAILSERDRGGAPCRRVRTLAAGKLSQIELQLRALRRWRR
jgi:DNA-binding transcriptional MerR regulator